METAKQLKLDHDVRPVLWEHWKDPSTKFDEQVVADDILSILSDNQINIVAKSIGTLVASHLIQKTPDKIQKIIFSGIPLNDINDKAKREIKQALLKLSESKILCFQNDKDPHGSGAQIKEFLAEINPDIRLIVKSGSDHEYPYYSEFLEFLKS